MWRLQGIHFLFLSLLSWLCERFGFAFLLSSFSSLFILFHFTVLLYFRIVLWITLTILEIYLRHLIDGEAMTVETTVSMQLTKSDMQQELRLIMNTRKWVQEANVLLRLCIYHSHCGYDLESRLVAGFHASFLWGPGLNYWHEFQLPFLKFHLVFSVCPDRYRDSALN
jgi:hypothetical protein